MSKPYLRTIDIAVAAAPLAAARTVLTWCTISAPPANAGNVTLTDPEGGSVALVPGEWQELRGIDLSQITAAGTDGDKLTIVGGA